MSGKFLLLILVIISVRCSSKERNNGLENEGAESIYLESIHDSLHSVVLVHQSDTNKWELPYPVYQFVVGDIDGNGVEDILVGVIKPTRFHSVATKRLFIFKNFEGYVRPMWLGSMMPQPLIDFWLIHNKDGFFNIITLEREKSGKMLVAEYCWQGFGLQFVQYHAREVLFR
jgi:hypothetical protein